VFSPYYAWAGRKDPENHLCLNVALYGPRSRWTMTERGRLSGERGRDHYRIGPSRLRWEGGALTVEIDEVAVPHLGRVRGTVRLIPTAANARAFAIDGPEDGARHWWRPIAPAARVEVDIARPAQRWSGAGYLDMNWGTEPLEAGFHRWDWSRAALAEGRSAILYDTTPKRGPGVSLGLRFAADGTVEELPPPARRDLPGTLWRVKRQVQADEAPRELRRFEDAPFYARAALDTRLWGERAHCVHETVDADRFGKGWVRMLLPWRMPRLP
jgi:carotenoid 1,2-hydratase